MKREASVLAIIFPLHPSRFTLHAVRRMAYAVKEIFYTLQGEGANTGRPAVFCRFAGCNLWTGREPDRRTPSAGSATPISSAPTGPAAASSPTAGALARAVAAAWPDDGPAGTPLRGLHRRRAAAPARRRPARRAPRRGLRGGGGDQRHRWPPPPGIDWLCVSPKAGAALVVREGDELKLVYPAGRRRAGAIRGARLRSFLPPADGRPRPGGQHRRRAALLPGPSALATEPPNA